MARKRCCFDVEIDVDARFKALCIEKGRTKSGFIEFLMGLAVDQYSGILQLAQMQLLEEHIPETNQDQPQTHY
jgi:hypothetical protein